MKKPMANYIKPAQYIERSFCTLVDIVREFGIAATKRQLWLIVSSRTTDKNGFVDGGRELRIRFFAPGVKPSDKHFKDVEKVFLEFFNRPIKEKPRRAPGLRKTARTPATRQRKPKLAAPRSA